MNLSNLMDFDTVIEVLESGRIIERPDIYGPSLCDDELDTDGWTLLTGFSGQDSYPGPIMHNSEYIGGGLERHIRETPGIYVALISYYTPENDDDDTDAEGWAIATAPSALHPKG